MCASPGNRNQGIRGGPSAAASFPAPRTPRQSVEPLNEIIRALEAKWHFGFKVTNELQSPAQNTTPVDKLQSKLKQVYWQNQAALDEALGIFAASAEGCLPNERLEILGSLLKCIPTQSGSYAGTPIGPKIDLSSTQTSRHTTPIRDNSRHDPPRPTSTDSDPGSPTDEDTDNDNVASQSPPASPSPSSRSAQKRIQASPRVPLLSSSAKKRASHGSSDRSEKAAKLAHTSKGKQASKSDPIPTPPLFKKPSLTKARQVQAAPSISSSANTSFNTTSSSQETAVTTTTSFTSYDGSVYGREIKLTRTSDTSTDMVSLDDDDLVRATADSEKRVLEQEIQRELNRTFSQEDGKGEKRSTFGSIDEDGLRDVSCEVEAKQVKPASTFRRTSPIPQATRSAFEDRKDPLSDSVADNRSLTASFPPYLRSTTRDALDTPPLRPRSSSTGLVRSKMTPQAIAPVDSPSKMSHEIRNLPQQNLFVEMLPKELEDFPYFILFICQRLALDYSISLQEILIDKNMLAASADPKAFRPLIESHPKIPRVKLQESNRLWQAQKRHSDGYTFKGQINFSPKCTGPIFNLRLSPIQADNSCRLQRIFGSDRFLYLNVSNLKSPKTERFNTEQKRQLQSQWHQWLLTEHLFLGRKWRAFYIGDIKKAKNSRRKDATHDKRIVLFATEGCGIESSYTVGDMLNRFSPFDANEEQAFCKMFARLDLGLSRTVPTLCFETDQITRVRDQLATQDEENTEFNDSRLLWERFPDGAVMNDGCCIISVGAAIIIWRLYCKSTGTTGPLPSAFQGRIGGAKGIWFISAESFTKDPEHLKPWIWINDSQWKFNPPSSDDPMGHHRTFELSNYSSAPSPSELHISFIPILADRGVPREVIADLITERLDEDRQGLLDLLSDPVKMYDWVHRNGSKTRTGIEPAWQAALPISPEERLKLLLESGFSAIKSPYLAKSLERFLQSKQLLQEAKLRVPLAKSTFLYGIADPFGVLKPGEIQVCFSTSFVDERMNEKYLGLRDMEALVARQPACRRSDIQKVRTVVHPRLSHLLDVVVMPSTGQYPLAGKLQGGDYDGDLFWICWQPALVNPFRNAPAPVQLPDAAKYNIQKKTEKLKDIMDTGNPDAADNFLHKAFEFRSNSSLLGLVTIFAEKQAYSENRIYSAILEALYDMHDLLVDASKQGYVFTQADFDRYVAGLPKQPKQPSHKAAMKDCAKAKGAREMEKCREKEYRYNSRNISDYLYFEVVRAHNIETMKQVKAILSKATELDETLLYPSQRLSQGNRAAYKKELLSLTTKLDLVRASWNQGMTKKDPTPEELDACVDRCYEKFQAILPDDPSDPYIEPLVEPYLTPGVTLWDKIKASALYSRFQQPDQSHFVFQMAGRDLVRLKADSLPHTRTMISELRTNLKPKPIKAPVQYDEEGEEEDEDDFKSALEDLLLG